MWNVCHTFGPQGAPQATSTCGLHHCWVCRWTSSSSLFNMVLQAYGVSAPQCGMYVTLLAPRGPPTSYKHMWSPSLLSMPFVYPNRTPSLSSFYTPFMGCVLPFVHPNRTPLLSSSGLTEENTGFPLSTATVHGLSILVPRPMRYEAIVVYHLVYS